MTLKLLNKIFHRKPSPCDNCDAPMLTNWISCDTCKNGCNKELQDFMKYRGRLMDNERQ